MKEGFTLIELIVVIGLMIAIGAVVLIKLPSRGYQADLTSATQDIVSLLREAQSDAMAQSRGVAWGVRFKNATSGGPFYALFASSTYSSSVLNGQYPLPSSVSYVTSTLASGSTKDIVFSQITGAASASTTIGLYVPNDLAVPSMSISISSSGVISY